MESASSPRIDTSANDQFAARSVGQFLAAFRYPLLDRPWGKLLLAAIVVAVCAARAYVGLVGSRMFSHDAFMLLDGAWRMMNGQRPHIDFYSHVGFLTYVPTLMGLWIAHGTAWGFGYGQALVAFLVGAWTWLLGRNRLADVPLALMCAAVAFTAVAPFSAGFLVLKMGPGTTYNRYGYALIALCVLEAVVQIDKKRFPNELWGGFSTGLVIATLLFLKITYFGLAAFLIIALIPCRPQSKQRWLGIAGGLGIAGLLCAAYLSFNITAMLRDLATIAGGKHVHFEAYMLDEILQHAAVTMALAISAAVVLISRSQPRRAVALMLAGWWLGFREFF